MRADSKTEAEVMAVLNQMSKAYATRDMDLLRSILVPDPDVTLIATGVDEKRVGLPEIQKQAERDWAQSESASFAFGWHQVSKADSVVWVAADLTFKAKVGGEEMVLPSGRMTAVLENRHGKWLIAQFHVSFPAAGQAEGESFPTS
ncbi:MAG: nuclear transport factor 2 family protein [Deinococcus sp.]|nr:nuclear transport factor 2 family protein [Deinococcus sp.]